MARKLSTTTICSICDTPNAPLACIACINAKIVEKYKLLTKLQHTRNSLQKKVQLYLKAKREADEQCHLRLINGENCRRLQEKLRTSKQDLLEGKQKVDQKQKYLNTRMRSLATAYSELDRKRAEELGKFYPDIIHSQKFAYKTVTSELFQIRRAVFRQLCKIFPLKYMPLSDSDGGKQENAKRYEQWGICGARLPVGNNLQSVPARELSASLGYMAQFLKLAANYLSGPLLHSAALAASSSRIWQRTSYWDECPLSRSEEYPLFIPFQGSSSEAEESHGLERSASYVGISAEDCSSMLMVDTGGGGSKYGATSSRSLEAHNNVEKGLKLLKGSVTCLTAYGFNLISCRIPHDVSTFEALADLMSSLTAKELHKRSSHPCDNSLAESKISVSSAMEESRHMVCLTSLSLLTYKGVVKNPGRDSVNSFLWIGGVSEQQRGGLANGESILADEWDMVEHPTLPPPPSQTEDVEHWTRAMIIDATK